MVSACISITLQDQKSSVVTGVISMIKNVYAKSPSLFEWFLFFASLQTPDYQSDRDQGSQSDACFPTFPAFPCPSTLVVLKDFFPIMTGD